MQDPIEAGKHEVYAVVDRGDGVYQKSSPFDFLIGTAVAESGNPDALSLALAADATPTQSNRSMLIYIISAAVIVLVVVIATIVIVKKARNKRKAAQTTPEQPVATAESITPTSVNVEPSAEPAHTPDSDANSPDQKAP